MSDRTTGTRADAGDTAARQRVDVTTWARKLEDAPAALQLPADRARPTALPPARERVTLPLTTNLVRAAAELGRATDADLYTVLLSAWQALLVRYSDVTDLVVGCAGGLPPGGFSAAAGDGVLVVRTRVEARDSFRSIVKTTATELRETTALGPVTVPELLAAMGAEPGPGKHPVYQVGFAAEGELRGTSPVQSAQHAPCDVVLRWTPDEQGVTAILDYSPQLFDAARMERMTAHLVELLGGALGDPDRAIAELPLLTAQEHEQLRAWNATERPHRRERSIAALFAEQVQRSPDAVAVELDGEIVSYSDLDRRANRLARALQDGGVGPDATVAISMERSVEMVVAVLAVLKAGGAYVPIDAAYPESRRSYMLDNSGAALLLVDAGSAAQTAAGSTVKIVPLGHLAHGGLDLSEVSDEPAVSEATGEHLGYVVYTSGSTGQPKGVALPQAALTNLVAWQVRRPGFAPEARTLQFASLSFDVSFQELFATWCSGGTLVLVRDAVRRDPRSLLDHVISNDVERLFLPFVALRGLAEAAVSSGTYPRRLREIYTAGEQLQVDDTVRIFFTELSGCVLENQYGPSESHVVTAYTLQGDPRSWPALPSIGGPIDNTTVHVLDPAGAQRPVGVAGELYIGGVCLAREYLGRPELTAERFVAHPLAGEGGRLYRTGDLARWTDEGTIQFLGRADNQVKFRGFRIEPGEVGAVLSSFPGVRQCVSTVADVADVGPRLAAYVLPAPGAEVRLDELHRFAQERLPDYMVPSHVMLMDAFPMTPSGKIDTQALPEPSFDRRILSNAHVPPRSDVERTLAEVWQGLLGVEDVGVHDDFFELGGDSLMAAEMFVVIEDRLNRALPLGVLAQDPTIAGLASHLTAGDHGEWRSLVPLRVHGTQPPLFFIHGGYGNVASFPKLVRELPDEQPAYALQWDGLDGSRGSRTIEAMAARYVEEVRSVQPGGPYVFVGQCIGGLVGMEMASLLRAQGEDVAALVMYDSPNVYSPNFRLPRLPVLPPALQGLANRVVGAAGNAARFAIGKRPRMAFLRVRLLSALHRGVPSTRDREHYGEMVMVRAAWRYRPRPVDVPIVYVHSGLRSASKIAMAGGWTDGMLGWAPYLSARFSAHHVRGGHNNLPYQEESVRLLTGALQSARERGWSAER